MLPNARLTSEMQNRLETLFYADRANYIARSQTSIDDYGQAQYSETLTPMNCSFTDKPRAENWKDYIDIADIDAEIRFSRESATPNKGELIELTGRFEGIGYPDARFEIIGIRNRDALGWLCALKRVTV